MFLLEPKIKGAYEPPGPPGPPGPPWTPVSDSPEEDEFLLIFQLKLGGGNCSYTQPLIPDSDGSEKDDFDGAVIIISTDDEEPRLLDIPRDTWDNNAELNHSSNYQL